MTTQLHPGFEHPDLPAGWHWPDKPPEHYDQIGQSAHLIDYWYAADGTALTARQYADRLQNVLTHLERH